MIKIKQQERILIAVATVMLAMWAVLLLFISQTIYRKPASLVSPIPNTTMSPDGVIRLTPKNGCGPFAHVENHPVYGDLCVQNDGQWVIGDSNATENLPAPCGDVNKQDDSLLSCQSSSQWTTNQ